MWPDVQDQRRHRTCAACTVSPLEDALAAMGVLFGRWSNSKPMTRLPPGSPRGRDARVQKVCIWTPDKDSRNVWLGNGSCRWIVGVGRFEMRRDVLTK